MTVVNGSYLSESSYFNETGESYISVKAKKVKLKDQYGRDDGSHYVPAKNPIKVKVGQKLKVVGYVINPVTNKPLKAQGFPIKIVEYNGKQYYYCFLCSNPTSKFLKKWANSDCLDLYGGGLGVDYGLWKTPMGNYLDWTDCSVSNYLLRRYFEDIHPENYDVRDRDADNKSNIPYLTNRPLAGYQSVYVKGEKSTDYLQNAAYDLEDCGVDLSVDEIEKY